jgi:hypothetical protein
MLSYGTSAIIYIATWRHNPEDHNGRLCCSENLKFQVPFPVQRAMESGPQTERLKEISPMSKKNFTLGVAGGSSWKD